eukprot:5331483-Pyramimonas_sp.AAC.1
MLQGLQTVFFQRGSSLNGKPFLYGPMKRELGGMVYSNIVDASWVYTGPPPPPAAHDVNYVTVDVRSARR